MIFNQSATLKIGSLEFNYPNFHMEWNYKVENDNSPSVLEITVFNLSDTNFFTNPAATAPATTPKTSLMGNFIFFFAMFFLFVAIELDCNINN